MKKTIILLSVLALLGCKKKKSEQVEDTPAPSTTSSSTTTGGSTTGNPPPAGPAFAAELTVTNTDHSYSYASARFYETSTDAVLIDGVKCNSKSMGQYPGNEYRYANSSSNYTGPVLWELSSSRAHIPDTSLYSPDFPGTGFTKNTSLTYDHNQDFIIPLDGSSCDSLFVSLGTVVKKIAGGNAGSSVTFKPGEGVKADEFDNTQVIVEVTASKYSMITVRGKKWQLRSVMTAQSYFKYK